MFLIDWAPSILPGSKAGVATYRVDEEELKLTLGSIESAREVDRMLQMTNSLGKRSAYHDLRVRVQLTLDHYQYNELPSDEWV